MKDLEIEKVLLEGGSTYTELRYKNEKELELLAIKNKEALFGKDSIYFDIKKLITSNANISKIPDGLLLTTTDFQDSKLWIIEYELSSHELERHIYPQIMGFINALKNESTKRSIKKMMYDNIKQNADWVKIIKDIIPVDGEIYHFLENVMERSVGIIVVIDRNIPELEEIVSAITSNMNLESHALEFITYQNNKGKKIHLLDKLPPTAKPSRVKSDVITWETMMARAAPNIKGLVENLIKDVCSKLQCVGKTWYKWYAFYTGEPANRKKLFAVIFLGKNTATLCFRVMPHEFKDDNNNVKYVKGFFFPTGTERRIHVEGASIGELLRYLTHSQEITKNAIETLE